MHYDLERFPDEASLVAGAVDRLLRQVATARAAGRGVTVALSGGRVAGRFLAGLAAVARENPGALDPVEFFWGDERCVPPDSPDSNYRLAADHLLVPAGIPAERVHRIRGELPPEEAAREADEVLRRVAAREESGMPVLDVVLLGMGEDGHVASLFPGAPATVESTGLAFLPVVGPKPPPQRISLTYPALAVADSVWVLASGAGKQEALRASIAPGGTTPLARLLGLRRATTILTDIPGE